MFKVTVSQRTDEYKEPSISSLKTYIRYGPGLTWLTNTVLTVRPGETWVETPRGFWALAEYPTDNDLNNIRTYCTYIWVEDLAPKYDPDDKIIRIADGNVLAEYHRCMTISKELT